MTSVKWLNEFSDKLIKDGKRKLARKFNISYGYIDDLISFNNIRFEESTSDIHPKELTIYEPTESTAIVSYLTCSYQRWEQQHNQHTIWQAW